MVTFTCTTCGVTKMNYGDHNADSECCACKRHKHIPRRYRAKRAS